MKIAINSTWKRSSTPTLPKGGEKSQDRIPSGPSSTKCSPRRIVTKKNMGKNMNLNLNQRSSTVTSAMMSSTPCFNLSNNSKAKIHETNIERSITNNICDRERNSNCGVIEGGPISPAFVRQKYRDMLTPFEITEVNDYRDVYFVGSSYSKKTNVRGSVNNYGFDLPPSLHYKAVVGDHIAYRYEVTNALGKGAFGEVFRCVDHKTKQIVAVKILVNTPLMHKQGLIEIKNMKTVCDTKYVLKILDHFVFRNHLCMVTELLGLSLFDQLKKNGFGPFQPQLIKSIAYEIMTGLAEVHRNSIIHGDLKPENILFTIKNGQCLYPNNNNNNNNFLISSSNSNIKNGKNKANDEHIRIIDFGSSCLVGHETYNYIQSRFYRAPEVILGIKYGTAIDIWSVGCILSELFTGKPLFDGDSERGQLFKFVETIGCPPINLVAQSPWKGKFFTSDGKTMEGNPMPFKTKLANELKTNDSLMIDFLSKCLEWDPNKRMTAEKAITHPWIMKSPKKAKTK